MAAKIRKGDRVVVLTGKDKGREGSVTKVWPKEARVLVSGLNIVQRHPRRLQGGWRQEGPYRQDDRRGDQWLIKLTNRG